MSFVQSIKQPLKLWRWRQRRAQAARRWGRGELARMPAVVGNAMPKSGSHLLIQVLLGLTKLGPFVDPGLPPLSRSAANRNLAEAEVLANLRRLGPGDIAYSYLHARPPYLAALTKDGVASFFIYRDPRDVIVSHVFYATEIHEGHGMHAYYTQRLSTTEQRIDAAIRGVQEPDAQLSPIRDKYEHYLGWLQQPAVMAVRFEALIGEREKAIDGMLDHLAARGFTPQPPRDEAIAILSGAIAPRASGTFRRGQPGEWREHFTEANKRAFKEAASDLLVRLGYEANDRW
jgi:hypothetical protein